MEYSQTNRFLMKLVYSTSLNPYSNGILTDAFGEIKLGAKLGS